MLDEIIAAIIFARPLRMFVKLHKVLWRDCFDLSNIELNRTSALRASGG